MSVTVESPARTGRPARTGAEAVAALQDAAREANRQAARVLRLTHETARSLGADLTARSDETEQYGADEVRAALVLSHAGARRRVELAECLVERLPEVLELLEAGLIDEPRARAVADTLRDADDDLAHLVCARVLPEAPGLVLGALIARLEEVLLALDPEWAARREAAARERRRVRAWRNPSGTGSLGSYDHPLDRVVGGVARLEALAAAARRAGARVGIDALRADAHMGLVDGLFAGLDDDQIVLALVEQHSGDDAADQFDEDAGAGRDAEDVDRPVDPGDAEDSPGPPPDAPAPSRLRTGTVEVRGPLTTVMGAEACPGEIAGWGPVTPGAFRALVASRRRAEWRVVVVDDAGHLVFVDLTRRRPAHCGDGGRRGDIVELWVSESELAGLEELARELAPDWEPVCRDVVARFRAWHDAGRPVPWDDPARRFPRAALARWISVRDRACVGPGCTLPAHAAEIDHTVDHGRGGPTADANLDPMCEHDHHLKHEGGWTLRQVAPGRFVWISRCGQRIEVAARPVRRDLPAPSPREDGEERAAPLDLEPLADDDGDPTGRTSSAWVHGTVPPWTRDPDPPVDPAPDGSPPPLPPLGGPDESPPF
ncbi:hypothetical protein ACQPX6_27625 [Actinomycetospora sp. CA-101289]|uniref:HNH endonuclease signature motif containing protein n=1 Tax=Actinomycetospora sp. CA-101289 TaxID=3239893 RepID=UPI003D960A9B